MLRSVLAGTVVVLLAITGLAITTPNADAATGALKAVAFAPSSTRIGDTGVSFSYQLTPATSSNVSSITFSVPSGTGAAKAGLSVTTARAWAGYDVSSLDGATAALAGTTLTVTFGGTPYLPADSQMVLTVAGLTNPTKAVSAATAVTTFNGSSVVDTGTTAAVTWTPGSASAAYVAPSSTATGDTGVSVRFGLTTATAVAAAKSVSVVLPPGMVATSGTPKVTSALPSTITGGSVTLTNGVLTYALPSSTSVSLPAGTAVALAVSGLTNPTVGGTYASEVLTQGSSGAVDSAEAPPVSFAGTLVTTTSWSPSATRTGATGVTYDVGFTIGTAGSVDYDGIVVNLPPGTTGTPTLTSLAVSPVSFQPSDATAKLVGGQLVVSFSTDNLQDGEVFSLEVGGLTNTPTAGSYPASIAVMDGGRAANVGVAPAVTMTDTALTSLSWSASSTAVQATGVTDTFGFGIGGTATTLTSLTITLPPTSAGTATLGAVTPSTLAGGTLTRSGQVLTYTLPTAQALSAGAIASVQVAGLANPTSAQSFTSTITAFNGSTAVASGATNAVSFTATALSKLSWGTTSSSTGKPSTYTFAFTTGSATTLTSLSMTLPALTTGTPAIGAVTFYSASQGTKTPTGLQVSTAGSKLVVTFTGLWTDQQTDISVSITGLTNTTAVGTYTSTITTYDATGAVDSGTTPAISLTSAVIDTPGWSVSSTATGQTGVTYTLSGSVSTPVTATAIRMSVPSDTAAGTGANALRLATAAPTAITGGTVSLAGGYLTYTLPAATQLSGAFSIGIAGLTNTATPGSFVPTITALNDGAPAASGSATAITFTSSVLASPTWTTSSTNAGATAATYTFGFTTASDAALTGVQVVLPAGTAGAPVLTSVSATQAQRTISLANPSIALTGSTLSLSFTSVQVPAGTVFALKVGGMTNAGAGTYQALIATRSGATSVDSASTPAVTLVAATLSMTPPPALRWVAAAVAGNAVVDGTPADQGYSVVDATGAAAGWNVSVSATTFSDGTHTLPDAGTFSVNGSLTSATATTRPAVTCTSTCTAPSNTLTYPVPITTGSQVATRIFSAAKGSGTGAFTIGGSTSTAPIGWWVHLPATVYAGTYTSTITFSISAGP